MCSMCTHVCIQAWEGHDSNHSGQLSISSTYGLAGLLLSPAPSSYKGTGPQRLSGTGDPIRPRSSTAGIWGFVLCYGGTQSLRAQFAWRGDKDSVLAIWGTSWACLYPAWDLSSSIQMGHLPHSEPPKLQSKWHLLSSWPIWKSWYIRTKACKCCTVFLSWGCRERGPWERVAGRWGTFSWSRIPGKQADTLSTPTWAILSPGWLISRQLPWLSTWLAELECLAQRSVFMLKICPPSSPTRRGVLTASSAASRWLNWHFRGPDRAPSP